MFRRALSGRDKILGKDHPSSIETAACFALFLSEELRFMESEDLWTRVLLARRKTMGDKNKDTAEAAYSLGMILQARNRYHDAAEAFKIAIVGFRTVYGPEALRTTAIEEHRRIFGEEPSETDLVVPSSYAAPSSSVIMGLRGKRLASSSASRAGLNERGEVVEIRGDDDNFEVNGGGGGGRGHREGAGGEDEDDFEILHPILQEAIDVWENCVARTRY